MRGMRGVPGSLPCTKRLWHKQERPRRGWPPKSSPRSKCSRSPRAVRTWVCATTPCGSRSRAKCVRKRRNFPRANVRPVPSTSHVFTRLQSLCRGVSLTRPLATWPNVARSFTMPRASTLKKAASERVGPCREDATASHHQLSWFVWKSWSQG